MAIQSPRDGRGGKTKSHAQATKEHRLLNRELKLLNLEHKLSHLHTDDLICALDLLPFVFVIRPLLSSSASPPSGSPNKVTKLL